MWRGLGDGESAGTGEGKGVGELHSPGTFLLCARQEAAEMPTKLCSAPLTPEMPREPFCRLPEPENFVECGEGLVVRRDRSMLAISLPESLAQTTPFGPLEPKPVNESHFGTGQRVASRRDVGVSPIEIYTDGVALDQHVSGKEIAVGQYWLPVDGRLAEESAC